MKKIVYLIVFACLSTFVKAQECPQKLDFDTAICAPTFSKRIDASVLSSRLCGDSLTIVFNAGGTNLDGDTNVYFHSGPQFVPFGGWSQGFTVGDWGQNNGKGRMKSLGSNLWSITIHPRTYYNYPADTCLDGIWMVFRNFNGTKKAADVNDQDIFLYTVPSTPTHSYPNISGTKTVSPVSYLWNDNVTAAQRTFTTGGTYTVTATSVGGCTATGSVRIRTAHAPVSLGPDVIRCTANTPVVLNATTQFSSYLWNDGNFNTISTYTATRPGCYTVLVLDSAGCPSSSTIQILNSEVTDLSLPDTVTTCPGGHVSVDASTNINLHGDSLVIVYDATKGQSGLTGATKVYFHSGPQFTPSKGWQQLYTVGNFGQDNGIGQMKSLGNNKWSITIDPYCYYHVNPDTIIHGIYMVFRNADGSQTGKGDNGEDIFIQLVNGSPNTVFSMVSASRTARKPLTYNWSNSVSGAVNNLTIANTYTVTVSDNSCNATASVVLSFKSLPPITLGPDTTLCKGSSVTLRAPAGFSTYHWTNNASTQTINVTTSGNYAVTATDSVGCQSTGSRKVTVSDTTVSIGNDIFKCVPSASVISATPGFATYQWLNGTPGDDVSYNAVKAGEYWVKAIDHAGCASYDTVTVKFSDVRGLNMPDTMNTCPGNFLNLDASISIEENGDSLVINYDATTGQTGLIGARKVYMHSGPQFHANQPWVGAYTVGNWGLDNGIGRMDSMGNNKWRITIQPRNYYHLNPDTPLTGIFMVFRNEDGTKTGRDGNGGDLYIGLNGTGIFPSFSAIYAFHKSSGPMSYLWSNNTSVAATAVSTPGPYTVTVTDGRSCTNTKTVQVTNNSTLSISLGRDTSICNGQTVVLTPGSIYTGYHWNTGDTTKTLNVTTTGTYSVSVNSGNCTASDSVHVAVHIQPVSVGTDIVRCTTSPVTLTASGTGFASFKWFGTGNSSNTIIANKRGNYWVKATDSTGCVSYDTVTVSNSATLALNIPDTLSTCSGNAISYDAATLINGKGDSLTITYDATKGTTGLTGATKVYMHSGPRFTTSPDWRLGYTVGNWGQDNGLGRMKSLGNNKWSITIDPVTYFNVPPDSIINGIFMVFRNADGSKEGKDNGGGDILLNLSGAAPASTFNGVTGEYKAAGKLHYAWSNGDTTSAVTFSTTGVFYLTVSDGNSCVQMDSAVVITSQAPQFSLGPDTNFCKRNTIVLEGPTGYASYKWNTLAITSSLNVSTPGTYTLTITNSSGCTASDAVKVDTCVIVVTGCGTPTAKFSVLSVSPGNTVTFRDSSSISKAKSYDWNFGDNTTGSSVGTTIHTYGAPGVYTVTLVIKDSCGGSSTFSKVVNVNATGISEITGVKNMNIYPNPSTGLLHIAMEISEKLDCQLVLSNLLGQNLWQQNEEMASGTHLLNVDASAVPAGVYLLQIISGNERITKRITITK